MAGLVEVEENDRRHTRLFLKTTTERRREEQLEVAGEFCGEQVVAEDMPNPVKQPELVWGCHPPIFLFERRPSRRDPDQAQRVGVAEL